MTRGIKRCRYSDLFHVERQLSGDNLRQRGGVPLARIQTASKNRRAPVSFHSDARRLALAAQ